MEGIQIYLYAFNTGKFNSECLECMEVLSTGVTLLAATNSAMCHNSNKHHNNKLQITICNCDKCASAIYELRLAELDGTK